MWVNKGSLKDSCSEVTRTLMTPCLSECCLLGLEVPGCPCVPSDLSSPSTSLPQAPGSSVHCTGAASPAAQRSATRQPCCRTAQPGRSLITPLGWDNANRNWPDPLPRVPNPNLDGELHIPMVRGCLEVLWTHIRARLGTTFGDRGRYMESGVSSWL